jgi:hypothetical protein
MCDKENLMNSWKVFYMQKLQQLGLLIDEQKSHEPNPLYTLINVTRQIDAYQAST